MILLVIQIKLLKITFVQKLSCPKAIYHEDYYTLKKDKKIDLFFSG